MSKKYDLKLKGYVGGWDFDSDYVDYILEKKADKEVHVLINSLGGDVATAFSIMAFFRNHGNVHVHYVGMNASAATVASLTAKHISIDANAMYLVHKCSSYVFEWDMMNADQLQQLIEKCEKAKNDLDKIDLNIASAYAARCKRDKAELLDLMKVGGWLTAQEALEWGFVDEITNEPEDEAPVIDEGVANFMANAGIPMPKGVKIEKQGGLLQRIIEALTPQKVINKTSQKMKKTFKFICAILLLEAMSFEENKTALTDEQVQKIEDEMARLNAENTQANEDLASRDQTIANLQAQLEKLRKKPAEEPVNVVDDSKKTVNNDFYRNVDEAQKLFNQTF